MLKWNGEQAKADVREELARRLLAAAVALQTELRRELSQPYPPASRPGQFPRLRTGWGRAHLLVAPTSLAEIARTLEVRLGYARNAAYMVDLELRRKRLGLAAAVKKYAPLLRKVLGSAASVSVKGA